MNWLDDRNTSWIKYVFDNLNTVSRHYNYFVLNTTNTLQVSKAASVKCNWDCIVSDVYDYFKHALQNSNEVSMWSKLIFWTFEFNFVNETNNLLYKWYKFRRVSCFPVSLLVVGSIDCLRRSFFRSVVG